MINVTTNPINSANSINFINGFQARNAFAQKSEPQESQLVQEEAPVRHISNSILNRIDVADVQKYAAQLGENELSDEELKYGLVFGRSVLVNVQA